ncbi:Ethanolamine ammonia-lyase heavy chain [Methylibium sp. T29]|nr:Ethanolamine ammonia-lyase heavy chain [Methylibium sp. T29]
MLNYQTTSFHDALYARRVLGLRPAPEFERWLEAMRITEPGAPDRLTDLMPPALARLLEHPR